MSLSRILTQRADVAWKEVEGQVILMDLGSKKMVHRLNSVSSFIWVLFDGKNSLSLILDRVCLEFSVDEEVAKSDLLVLVEQLIDLGVLHGS
ncbi:MAG: hypothetical protein CME70_15680 [Halobacteriovorax sp.]|nr:hypothetical protein [Halobacteriovorax sp.]|tara:strand:- start:2098 stop:2373 length:276 start_codon:yes stop_codon:yes gene_type:complete